MKVVSIAKTCDSCPQQWEGELEDGRFFYARGRWGHLEVTTGITPNDAVLGAVVYSESYNEHHQLTDDELLDIVGWQKVLSQEPIE